MTLANVVLRKMTCVVAAARFASTAQTYEAALQALNTLQSNADYIRERVSNYSMANHTLNNTKKYLFRSGITLEDLDRLSVIHVAGTKGKGSTCAFTESILRNYGYRTGFYSSPHLIQVTERIRINGKPISQEQFAKQFWMVYNSLYSQKENDTDMPAYFNLLTILMFHVFLNASVDVAILEVGIGGEYDSTNIVPNPICVGITSLGYDHTSLLGKTIESIAFQKSGIFKKNSIAFTVQQCENAMNVLQCRAKEKNCKLSMVPDFKSYNWNGDPPILGIAAEVQEINASLSIQLSHTWMTEMENRLSKSTSDKNLRSMLNQNHPDPIVDENNDSLASLNKSNGNANQTVNETVSIHSSESNTIHLADHVAEKRNHSDNRIVKKFPKISFKNTACALSSCIWPGRTQFLCGKTMNFYIDGAHTVESIELCISWFLNKVENQRENLYLIFNVTGDRDTVKLMRPLKCLNFKTAYFVPNVADAEVMLDQTNIKTPVRNQIEKCRKNHNIWGNGATVLNSVSAALKDIRQDSRNIPNNTKPQVLITGSLHLVGAALTLLDPNLTMNTCY